MDDHTISCLDFQGVRDLLAGYACCALGRGLAEHIQPSTKPALVRRWHAQIAELEAWTVEHDLPPMAGVSDVRDIIQRCAPPLRVEAEELARVGDLLAAAAELRRYFARLPSESVELIHLRDRLGDFSVIVERIRRVIDERGHLHDHASPKLARLRGEIAQAEEDIGTMVERLLDDAAVRRLLQFPNHTFFNDRVVLPLRTEYRGRLPGIIHRVSDSGATLFVEPAQAVEANNRISDLRAAEGEEIKRLLWELAHEVNLNAEAILATIDGLAVLDLVIAKLRYARDYGLRSPDVLEEPLVVVREARHPLLLKLVREQPGQGRPREVVPIDYRLGDDFDLLVITGPNTGGKTITLKTIGLIALMVQAGLRAPVGEGSRMGVFRRILIDIGDEQSMQQSLSTFSAHMTRQLDMLQHAGPHTLLLFDELGAGTDPDEGAALGWAMLDELLTRQCRAVATTHIGALKSFPLVRERAENACVEFDPDTLLPLYRLKIGEPGVSNAIAVAERLGLPRRLVEAARAAVSPAARRVNKMVRQTVKAKRLAEQAREQAEQARIVAGAAAEEARSERNMLERQKRDYEQWVRSVVHLQPGDAVRLRGFDRDGRIVRIRLDVQRAEVDVGAFCVEAPLGDVLPPAAPAPPPRPERRREGEGQRSAGPAVKYSPRRQRRERPGARQAGEPGRAAPGSGPAHRGDPGGRAPVGRNAPRGGDSPRRTDPNIQTLSDAEALALNPGDTIYVKRFHRTGTIVRVVEAKKHAVVSLGLLEVDVPFSGLARTVKGG